MILYRIQALDDEGNTSAIGIDNIMEAKDLEKFFDWNPLITFKVTTLKSEDEYARYMDTDWPKFAKWYLNEFRPSLDESSDPI